MSDDSLMGHVMTKFVTDAIESVTSGEEGHAPEPKQDEQVRLPVWPTDLAAMDDRRASLSMALWHHAVSCLAVEDSYPSRPETIVNTARTFNDYLTGA